MLKICSLYTQSKKKLSFLNDWIESLFIERGIYRVDISLFMARTLNSVREENISRVFFSVINRECIFFLILRYGECYNRQMFYRTLKVFKEWDTMYTDKAGYTETLLIRTTHYYGRFALSLGKERSYIFSKLNPLLRTLSTAPSVSVLTSVWPPRCPYSRKFALIIRQI